MVTPTHRFISTLNKPKFETERNDMNGLHYGTK